MKFDWRLLVVLMLSLGLMVGCESDDEEETPPVGTFNDISAYMTENGLDLPEILAVSWIKAAVDVVDENDSTVSGYTVLDIRGADDFAAGHISGAVNTTLGEILTAAEANDEGKPFMVVCYTGQTAGQAVMALRLMGYTDAIVLKFGMCGWNDAFASRWNDAAGTENGNKVADNANWVYTEAPALETYDYPAWESETTDGAALLAERVEATLDDGFISVAATTVLDAPANYQILNYWTEEDYLNYGHFDGAYQLNPISITDDVITAIDPDNLSAVYCFTGQTSSMVTFWLNVLGYDATSILYGVNTLNYDPLAEDGKPNWHGPADYAYVID